MKILVVSDSHGYLNNISLAISVEKPDYMIHLGDYTKDADQIKLEFPMLPVVSVKGNCDYCDFATRDHAQMVYDGVKILAVHGHMYGVKSGLLRLFMAAKEKAVHVALFGHTHCAYCEIKDGLWLMNPGSCGSNSRRTYGIIEISEGNTMCSIKTLDERVK